VQTGQAPSTVAGYQPAGYAGYEPAGYQPAGNPYAGSAGYQPTGNPYAGYPGYPQTGPPGYPAQGTSWPDSPRTNGLAVASLACACAGIIPFLFGLPALLGIIFGFVARSQIKNARGAQGGAGLALAGIIVGFSLIGLFLLAVILVAIFQPSNAAGMAPVV
jgi:hypothetical protein